MVCLIEQTIRHSRIAILQTAQIGSLKITDLDDVSAVFDTLYSILFL